jgi:MoxR-like ATPase
MDIVKLNSDEIAFGVDTTNKISQQFANNVIGQGYLLNRLIISLYAKLHILVEGVPGLAKTRAINTIAKSLNLKFSRIQFTPDLLPTDIIGNLVFNPKDNVFLVKLGPVFANVLLADEINRAPAKVQSALLEAMGEQQVTIGEKTYPIESPFLVMATQNPIEQEGTFPLPEAQMDRFALKAVVNYPQYEEEVAMLNLIEKNTAVVTDKVADTQALLKLQSLTDRVLVSDQIKRYIASIVHATRFPHEFGLDNLSRIIAFGVSPRAGIAFLKLSKALALTQGRDHVIPEDIKELGNDILRHRLVLGFEAQADGIQPEQIIENIFSRVQIP